MFIAIILPILGCVAFLSVRDWVFTDRLTSKSVQKSLKLISGFISLAEWDKAKKELQPLLQKGIKGKEIALYEIQVLRGTETLSPAFEKVKTALKKYPDELLFKLEEAKILLGLNRAKEAVEAFSLCIPILRAESDLIALASALVHAGFSHQCLDLIYPWIHSTQNGKLLNVAADAFFEQKRFQDAIEMYRRALELGERSHCLFTQMGHAYRRLGNLAEAEKIFRKLVEKDSQDVEATLGWGACLQERGHFQKALLTYQSGRAWETKDLRLLHQAGICALRSKKFEFAHSYFSEILKLQQTDPLLLSYYGLSLEGLQKWQEAEQTYLKLIQQFSSHPHGYRALSWMFGVGLTQTLSHEQGLSFAYRSLKLKQDPHSWEILSACLARVGNFDKAYRIQLHLGQNDQERDERARRQRMLRLLRKKIPLDNQLVIRALVA